MEKKMENEMETGITGFIGGNIRDLDFRLGTAPVPVTVYVRGPIRGYIYPYYIYYLRVITLKRLERWLVFFGG